ncbi:MAG: hypothetical protein ACYC56_12955 [Candidatus Aquicultor sp.]
MIIIALISFLIVAFIYSFLAAFTKVFYKNRPVESLGASARNVLYNRATISEHFTLFFSNFLSSVVSPPVYILAIILTGIIYLLR